jgi:hypothetical protein
MSGPTVAVALPDELFDRIAAPAQAHREREIKALPSLRRASQRTNDHEAFAPVTPVWTRFRCSIG